MPPRLRSPGRTGTSVVSAVLLVVAVVALTLAAAVLVGGLVVPLTEGAVAA